MSPWDVAYAAASIALLGGAAVTLCAATVLLSTLAGHVLHRWTQRSLDDLLDEPEPEPDLEPGWRFSDLSEQWVRDEYAAIVARLRHPAGRAPDDDTDHTA
jgi:hypothetical protein